MSESPKPEDQKPTELSPEEQDRALARSPKRKIILSTNVAESSVTIDAEAERGMKFWRVSGAWGGTRPRPFLVGDLPEHVETEPNSTPERAERITLPVVVNALRRTG